MARTTLSRSTLWRLSREGRIPQPIQITPHRIGWREADITAWLNGAMAGAEPRA
jgi:prophage regulatory protein